MRSVFLLFLNERTFADHDESAALEAEVRDVMSHRRAELLLVHWTEVRLALEQPSAIKSPRAAAHPLPPAAALSSATSLRFHSVSTIARRVRPQTCRCRLSVSSR